MTPAERERLAEKDPSWRAPKRGLPKAIAGEWVDPLLGIWSPPPPAMAQVQRESQQRDVIERLMAQSTRIGGARIRFAKDTPGASVGILETPDGRMAMSLVTLQSHGSDSPMTPRLKQAVRLQLRRWYPGDEEWPI